MFNNFFSKLMPCRIFSAADTLSSHSILNAFPQHQLLCEYVYRCIACLVIYYLVEMLASKYIIKIKKVQEEYDNSTQTPKLCVMWKTYSVEQKTLGYVQ